MAQILGSSAGTYSTAKALYASNAGAWVEVPLGGGTTVAPWTRPTDWLTTNVGVGEQKIQTLVHLGGAGSPDSDRAMTLYVTGAYTVDWGDGTAPQNVATATTATHLYAPTALVGTETTEGRRQALITITPQAGQTLATLDMTKVYFTGKTWTSPAVEIVVGPSLTGFVVSVTGNNTATRLMSVDLKSELVLVNGTSLFAYAWNLREVKGSIRVTGTSSWSMFYYCYNLERTPSITFDAPGTTASTLFSYSGITTVPTNVNYENVGSANSMFFYCYNLKSCGDINLAVATTAADMFNECRALETVGTISGPNVQVSSALFAFCIHLQHVGGVNFPKATTVSGMFNSCRRLTHLPPLSFPLATDASSMLTGCNSLLDVTLSLPVLTNANGLFATCRALHTIAGDLNLAAVTPAANLNNAFLSANSLRNLSFAAGKAPLLTFSLADSMLSAETLNAIYTALPTVTGQTLTVTTAFGTGTDDPTIATAKGWTVTGS